MTLEKIAEIRSEKLGQLVTAIDCATLAELLDLSELCLHAQAHDAAVAPSVQPQAVEVAQSVLLQPKDG